jgi:acyl carrier protein
MNRQAIFQTLEGFVKLRTGLKSDIAPDAKFKEDLEIDSLLVVDIVIDIEKHYDISLPEDEIPLIATLNDATDAVHRVLAASVGVGNGGQEQSQSRLLCGVGHLA